MENHCKTAKILVVIPCLLAIFMGGCAPRQEEGGRIPGFHLESKEDVDNEFIKYIPVKRSSVYKEYIIFDVDDSLLMPGYIEEFKHTLDKYSEKYMTINGSVYINMKLFNNPDWLDKLTKLAVKRVEEAHAR